MLGLLRDAASSATKLLIVDVILPYACYDDSDDNGERIPGAVRSLVPEGSPLLANLGKANANAYWLDLTVRPSPQSQFLGLGSPCVWYR